MKGSHLYEFVERIKTDTVFRQRVVDAEKEAARGMSSIQEIAAEAGYDIAAKIGRPDKMRVTPTDQELEDSRCVLTCCWVETSVWDTEGPSIGGF